MITAFFPQSRSPALSPCVTVMPKWLIRLNGIGSGETFCARAWKKVGWPVNKPQAGMFAGVKLPEQFAKLDSMQFAMQLMQEANVAVAPGIGCYL